LFESSQIKQYVIVGRKKPTTLDPEPKIFKTKLFASNVVVAKSRFFYFLGNLKRVKRSNGEILSIQEVQIISNAFFPQS
jgi:large subunit ribosomal protein L18Ae